MKTREEIEARIAEYLRQRHAIEHVVSFHAGPLACDPRKWNRGQRLREIGKLDVLIRELQWVLQC